MRSCFRQHEFRRVPRGDSKHIDEIAKALSWQP